VCPDSNSHVPDSMNNSVIVFRMGFKSADSAAKAFYGEIFGSLKPKFCTKFSENLGILDTTYQEKVKRQIRMPVSEGRLPHTVPIRPIRYHAQRSVPNRHHGHGLHRMRF